MSNFARDRPAALLGERLAFGRGEEVHYVSSSSMPVKGDYPRGPGENRGYRRRA